MSEAMRWRREFTSPSSFSDDLGALGTWVGPRTGNARRTQGDKEDYVLRRVLVALNRQQKLCFPFTVCASDRIPGQPDFTIRSADGTWGLEVTEAGSESHQERMTRLERVADNESTLFAPDSLDSMQKEFQRSIKKKVEMYDDGWYRGVTHCDLAVYDNTNSFSVDRRAIAGINDRCLHGRFREVFFVQSSGLQVYRDVLSDDPRIVDIASDYNIDFAEWIGDQVDLLRRGRMNRLDVEELIEELSALARKERRALGSHLENLLLHLLKWQFQPQRRGRSWKIVDQQRSKQQSKTCWKTRQVFVPQLSEVKISEGVSDAPGKTPRDETGLSTDTFPEVCPFEPDNVRTTSFYEWDWFPA